MNSADDELSAPFFFCIFVPNSANCVSLLVWRSYDVVDFSWTVDVCVYVCLSLSAVSL